MHYMYIANCCGISFKCVLETKLHKHHLCVSNKEEKSMDSRSRNEWIEIDVIVTLSYIDAFSQTELPSILRREEVKFLMLQAT